jgi:hypothetical protein
MRGERRKDRSCEVEKVGSERKETKRIRRLESEKVKSAVKNSMRQMAGKKQ